MVRGERDYTQRVLARIRPMGIGGGGILRLEDFETLLPKDPNPGTYFSLTNTQGEVWEGDRSGKYSLPQGYIGIYTLDFPQPIPTIISAEVVFRRISGDLSYMNLRFEAVYEGIKHFPAIQVYDNGTNLVLQYADSSSAYVTALTLGASPIDTKWHMLYFRVNIETKKYELIQYDAARKTLPEAIYTTGATGQQPYGSLAVYCKGKPTSSLALSFDNLIVAYEDI